MGYLNDYIYYGSGHECPDQFQLWAGLSLLGACAGRKIWLNHGEYFTVYPNIYVCLVGTAGSGKSTARSQAKSIFVKNFPTNLVSASIQSREDIADQMAQDMCTKLWRDVKGEYGLEGQIYEYRPFYIVANELSSFLSVDKGKMVEFLVDIFDENHFSTGFKGQRKLNPEAKQWFDNPFVSMLCCAVPKWFMNNLKLDLFDGGLGRRLFIVYCEKTKLIDTPMKPEGADICKTRFEEHLKMIGHENFYGEVKRTPGAMSWWKKWYHDPKRFNKEDPILMQFHETKSIQLLKVAMLLALSEYEVKMQVTEDHLEAARIMIDALEPNIVRLTSGIGRNEIAGVGTQFMDFLLRNGGAASEVHIKKFFRRYVNTHEFEDMINSYCATEELVKAVDDTGGVQRIYYFTPEAYLNYQKKKSAQIAAAQRAPGSVLGPDGRPTEPAGSQGTSEEKSPTA